MKASAKRRSRSFPGTASAAFARITSSLPRRPLAFIKSRVDRPTDWRPWAWRSAQRNFTVLEIPVIRWGQPYESLEKQDVVHFETGETLATVHQANGGIVKMDMRKAQRARDVLREFSIPELVAMVGKAADLYLNAALPLGDGTQTPAEFCRMQSATTGLPEHMCAANMKKNAFVLTHMDQILDALTRGLPYEILTRGFGDESRGVIVSFQANAPVLGAVLPS